MRVMNGGMAAGTPGVRGGAWQGGVPSAEPEREFFIDNLLVRIHFIIVMIRWTGLAPWEFEFPRSQTIARNCKDTKLHVPLSKQVPPSQPAYRSPLLRVQG